MKEREINKGSRYLSLFGSKYLKEMKKVSKLDPLSREQEREYIRKYREEGDVGARNEVVIRSLLSVLSRVSSLNLNNDHIDITDLVSELNLELIKAIDKYDIKSEARFNTFVFSVLRFKLLTYLVSGWQLVRIPKTRWVKYKNENKGLADKKFFISLRDVNSEEDWFNDSEFSKVDNSLKAESYLRSYFEESGTQMEADIIILRFYCEGKETRSFLRISKCLGIKHAVVKSCWATMKEKHVSFFEKFRKKLKGDG